MQKIANWIKSYNASTHCIALTAVGLVAAYKGYPPFHNMVTGIYTGLPQWAQVMIGTGGFLYALYKTGQLTSSAFGKKQEASKQ